MASYVAVVTLGVLSLMVPLLLLFYSDVVDGFQSVLQMVLNDACRLKDSGKELPKELFELRKRCVGALDGLADTAHALSPLFIVVVGLASLLLFALLGFHQFAARSIVLYSFMVRAFNISVALSLGSVAVAVWLALQGYHRRRIDLLKRVADFEFPCATPAPGNPGPTAPSSSGLRTYAFLGMVSGVSFVVAFGLGSLFNVATGIPLIGGLVNGVLVCLLLTVGLRTVGRFPAATVMWVVFGLLSVPTTTLGPPGIYKILPAAAGGLTWDVFVTLARGRRWGYLIGGLLGSVVIMLGIFAIASLFGLPAAAKLRHALYFLLPVNGGLAVLGIWLGLVTWERRLQRLELFRSFGS